MPLLPKYWKYRYVYICLWWLILTVYNEISDKRENTKAEFIIKMKRWQIMWTFSIAQDVKYPSSQLHS